MSFRILVHCKLFSQKICQLLAHLVAFVLFPANAKLEVIRKAQTRSDNSVRC